MPPAPPPATSPAQPKTDRLSALTLRISAEGEGLAERLRTTNPYIVDTAIAVLVWVALSVQFIVPRAPSLPPASTSSYFLTCLCAVPLIWRRRFPLTVLLLVNVPAMINQYIDGVGQPLPYAGLIATYTVAAISPLTQRLVMNGIALVVIPLAVAFNSNQAREYLFTFFTYFGAYALGRLTHTRQERAREVEARAEQLERTREAEAQRAVAEERARIARDMHDVLSHAVSIMIVQAEAGPLVVRKDPDRAERAFDAIASAGRDAMTQLRRMLGVLKEEPGDALRVPQPTLDDLQGLVSGVSSSGPAVSLDVTGSPTPLPADAQVAIYRIVQEALTNVVKHARATRVTVALDWTPGELTASITDDGRGPSGASDGRGHGMISFRERAAAHGGTVTTGPGPSGGFQVTARFPLTPASEPQEVTR
ncbi:two-component sensor histidine kinase [Actinorhabdospora filicis]|uniref:histidine kinase n=1 Tax=Actinorhabdospora filicis TaxID=1785913 RepID=A0A9W6W306_9ACTN|nr:sensor histidine kinase [Actinorhabdospora filicis]GLZ77602.1 two-component sensor histidine kinase [Actinorhabdospora filicis]